MSNTLGAEPIVTSVMGVLLNIELIVVQELMLPKLAVVRLVQPAKVYVAEPREFMLPMLTVSRLVKFAKALLRDVKPAFPIVTFTIVAGQLNAVVKELRFPIWKSCRDVHPFTICDALIKLGMFPRVMDVSP